MSESSLRVALLQRQITGEVVTPAAANYEDIRRSMVWNQLTPERRPELIVRARSDDDVVATVRFAREHDRKVAIRSGGHSWWGAALRDGGILLDLGGLDQVSVDATASVASIQPGVRGRDLGRALSAYGLAFPYGHCPSVAMGGYLLSGGFGWNSSAWGPACFSVEAVDVVTAEGVRVHASADMHPDLLWAARGAGPGFFGVVTRYDLKLYRMPPAILSSTYVYPLASLREIGSWVTDLAQRLPRTVELAVLLAPAPPPADALCVRDAGRACIVMGTAFADTPAEAVAALATLESCPVLRECLSRDRYRPTRFDALFHNLANMYPERHRYLAEALWSNTAPHTLLTELHPHLTTAPSRKSHVLAVLPPPPPADAPPPDAAFSMTAGAILLCYAIWEDAADDAANHAWHAQMVATLEPYTVGNYVGESNLAANPARAERSFAPPNWQRFQALRRQYDPHGLFHGFDTLRA